MASSPYTQDSSVAFNSRRQSSFVAFALGSSNRYSGPVDSPLGRRTTSRKSMAWGGGGAGQGHAL